MRDPDLAKANLNDLENMAMQQSFQERLRFEQRQLYSKEFLKDRYGLHAYLTALENSNLRGKLETEIRESRELTPEEKSCLQEVLQTGRPPVDCAAEERTAAKVAPLTEASPP